MKITYRCPICTQETIENGTPDFSPTIIARIPEDGVINVTCSRGHQTTIIIQQSKFEILSEMAIKAIIDGYYRDAVASFATSLERLYEFFVCVTSKKHNIATSTFNSAWKNMSKQSERQLGAFIGLYLIETGQAPKLLHQNQTAFRNKIIHQGLFPERDETVQFGQAVLDCVRPILQLLKTEPYLSLARKLRIENTGKNFYPKHIKGATPVTLFRPTPFGLDKDIPISIEAEIAAYAKRPEAWQL